MMGCLLTIMANKGEGELKRDRASFVKLCACFDDEADRVKVTSIGIQIAGNTSKGAATGVGSALQVFDYDDKKNELDNGDTNTRGGGTREDSGKKLNNIGRVRDWLEFLTSTCGLHGINLTFLPPTALVLGERAMLRRITMQLLHTAYNLSQQLSVDKWAEVWTTVTNKSCV